MVRLTLLSKNQEYLWSHNLGRRKSTGKQVEGYIRKSFDLWKSSSVLRTDLNGKKVNWLVEGTEDNFSSNTTEEWVNKRSFYRREPEWWLKETLETHYVNSYVNSYYVNSVKILYKKFTMTDWVYQVYSESGTYSKKVLYSGVNISVARRKEEGTGKGVDRSGKTERGSWWCVWVWRFSLRSSLTCGRTGLPC